MLAYVRNHTTFELAAQHHHQQQQYSTTDFSKRNTPLFAFPTVDVQDMNVELLKQTSYDAFTALCAGKSWCNTAIAQTLPSNTPVVDVVKAKFSDEMILRVDNESILVVSEDTALLQSRSATARQSTVLSGIIQLFGWDWALIEFQPAKTRLVLKNRNNPRAEYDLSAALRIELPAPLQALCRTLRREEVASRKRVPALPLAAATPAAAPVDKASPSPPRKTRRRRSGFHKDTSPRLLLSLIHRNQLLPTPEQLERQEKQQRRRKSSKRK